MTETKTGNEQIEAGVSGKQTASQHIQGHSVYTYASAGIAEREGSVPTWLWLVVASLLVWGFYYLVTYWNAPIGPT